MWFKIHIIKKSEESVPRRIIMFFPACEHHDDADENPKQACAQGHTSVMF